MESAYAAAYKAAQVEYQTAVTAAEAAYKEVKQQVVERNRRKLAEAKETHKSEVEEIEAGNKAARYWE